MSRNC